MKAAGGASEGSVLKRDRSTLDAMRVPGCRGSWPRPPSPAARALLAARAPCTKRSYPCCTFRGSLSKLDLATGRRLWTAYTTPPNGGKPGWSGNAIWSNTAVVVGNVVYATTGASESASFEGQGGRRKEWKGTPARAYEEGWAVQAPATHPSPCGGVGAQLRSRVGTLGGGRQAGVRCMRYARAPAPPCAWLSFYASPLHPVQARSSSGAATMSSLPPQATTTACRTTCWRAWTARATTQKRWPSARTCPATGASGLDLHLFRRLGGAGAQLPCVGPRGPRLRPTKRSRLGA